MHLKSKLGEECYGVAASIEVRQDQGHQLKSASEPLFVATCINCSSHMHGFTTVVANEEDSAKGEQEAEIFVCRVTKKSSK